MTSSGAVEGQTHISYISSFTQYSQINPIEKNVQ